MEDEFDNTLTLTEFGQTLNQNSGYGTKHVYGTAILTAGVLLKNAPIHADWPGLETEGLFGAGTSMRPSTHVPYIVRQWLPVSM